jgi:tripartite-type tricarboxylate transporter receptor subunit TctC
VGGTLHLAIELLQHMGNVKMVHVPYKGTPTLIVDLVAGQIQLGVMSVNLVVPYVKSNRMRPIAITANQRTDLLPNVPTMDEAGMKGYDVRGWYGLVAPGKTPAAVVAPLNKALAQALQHPDVKTVLGREGARAGGEPPENFSDFLRTERDKYRKLIADANLRRETTPSGL